MNKENRCTGIIYMSFFGSIISIIIGAVILVFGLFLSPLLYIGLWWVIFSFAWFFISSFVCIGAGNV